jgi:hypothetical protein
MPVVIAGTSTSSIDVSDTTVLTHVTALEAELSHHVLPESIDRPLASAH